jgi:hypothetical protein
MLSVSEANYKSHLHELIDVLGARLLMFLNKLFFRTF